MGWSIKLKHYVFAAIAGTAPSPHSKGNPGKGADALAAIADFVADLGVSASTKRQLVGIEQIINWTSNGVGDMAVCIGPPDAFAIGAFAVMIGGMPAARMGDLTTHGGSITVGFPTVMIG